MGPNGAGKTTCFNVLTGRYKPDRGRVLFDGRDITGRSPQAIARLGVARSFQIMNLFDEFTVFENVAIALPATRARGRDPLGQAYADPRAGRARRTRSSTASASRDRADDVGQGAALRRAPRAGDRAWRSPAGPSCCSSTSRPPASAATAARGSPSWSAS